MHSPLPDSSALESGILEDPRPTRLSRVQENVRNLLRNSTFGSIHSSPSATPAHIQAQHRGTAPPTPPETPTRTPIHQQRDHPEVLPSPTESLPSTASPTSSASSLSSSAPLHPADEETPSGLFPPPAYLSPLARLSKLLAPAVTSQAVDHPDVSETSVEVLARQKAVKRQRRAWKRKRVGTMGESRKGRGEAGSGGTQCLLCVIAALMLASIIATYLIVATTSSNITTTFHVLFILGIILATIVFAHTFIRLLLVSGSFRRGQQVLILPTHNKRRHYRRHHNARRGDSLAVQHVRAMPGLSSDATEFVPATPIPVQVGTEDEVRTDTRDPVPTAIATEVEAVDVWNKAPSPIANPPPAYGRWRGSVRANPDLLHWRAIPSPIDDDAQELPSPTYEEAMMAQRTGPPSYVTRESPARTAEREDVRGSVLQRADAQERVVEPEMVEVVGHAGGSVGVAK